MLYVLSLFPWTRGIAEAILGYILDPLRGFAAAVVAFLPDLFFLIVIAFITRYVIKLARFFFHEVERGRVVLSGFYADWADPTFKIVRFFILAFALTVAFPYIPGSKSEAFKGVSIFLGVLFSHGSYTTISNLMAGLSINYIRAFKVGDRVRIGDTVGDVIDQSLLVTHLRTIKNEDVTVPNAMVLSAHIVNYSARAREEGSSSTPRSPSGTTPLADGPRAPDRGGAEDPVPRDACAVRPANRPQRLLRDVRAERPHRRPPADGEHLLALHRNIQDTFNEAG
jgi:small-conductance mechanosensitive channel